MCAGACSVVLTLLKKTENHDYVFAFSYMKA